MPFIVVFPLKIVIFHSYVSLPEGKHELCGLDPLTISRSGEPPVSSLEKISDEPMAIGLARHFGIDVSL